MKIKVCAEDLGVWQSIPSTGGKYEMMLSGRSAVMHVRNAKTKRELKNRVKDKTGVRNGIKLRLDGKLVTKYLNSLRQETFGVDVDWRQPSSYGVFLQKGGENLYFPSLRKAAAFLATKVYWSKETLMKRFKKRIVEIDGWKVFYRDCEKRIIKLPRIHGDEKKDKKRLF